MDNNNLRFPDAKRLADHSVIESYEAVRHFEEWYVILYLDELRVPVLLYNTHGALKYYKTLDALVRDVQRISGKDINKLLLR
jgi:hypothetical protein